jgi:hypothetical protein
LGGDGNFFTIKITEDDLYCTGYVDQNDKWSSLEGWGKLFSSEDEQPEFSEIYSDLLKSLPEDDANEKLTQHG